MGTIIARPAPAASGSSLTIQENGSTAVQSATTLNFSGSFTVTQAGQEAIVEVSGSSVGSIFYSPDGGPPRMYVPLTAEAGWLVNDDGIMLVAG